MKEAKWVVVAETVMLEEGEVDEEVEAREDLVAGEAVHEVEEVDGVMETANHGVAVGLGRIPVEVVAGTVVQEDGTVAMVLEEEVAMAARAMEEVEPGGAVDFQVVVQEVDIQETKEVIGRAVGVDLEVDISKAMEVVQ